MTTQFIGVREFRQNLTQLYQKAQKKDLRYIVLNKNKPVFEVTPILQRESTLESLQDRVKKARADVKAGRVYTLEQIEEELGL